MPPLPPAPAVADQAALLEQTQQLLDMAPRLAFEKASLLRDPLLRERLRRDAFLSLTRTQPKEAAGLLPQVIQARWLPMVNFAQALDVAWFTVREQPELSKQFLLATAVRHPAVALREVRQFIDLPYGPAIREAARRAAATTPPDLQLLQIRQNPSLAAALNQPEILCLAAAAQTENERETALTLLTHIPWELPADPAALRGALALLSESGAALRVPAPAIRAAFQGIDDAADPLAEAVKAASILAVAPEGVEDSLPSTPLGRLLRSQRQAPADTALRIADLFPGNLCLQRYIFHNDDDGVESFESFLRFYQNEANWTIQRSASLVHLTGRGAGDRRIEIYANIPVDLQLPAHFAAGPAIRARQKAVTAALPAEPTVIVHRGHDHHFEETRKYLRQEARLVFLGSCHGMSNVEDVVTRCRRAQMIATRGVGTTAVNDTFLKALNTKLLGPGDTLEWDSFWASLRTTLNGSEHFHAYVPPHKNPGARFLADWYRQALSAP